MTTGNALSKAQWYANRLRAMSAGEIAHRFTELARKRRAGKRSFGWCQRRRKTQPLGGAKVGHPCARLRPP